jgi:hypothetical protein
MIELQRLVALAFELWRGEAEERCIQAIPPEKLFGRGVWSINAFTVGSIPSL